MGSGPEQIGPSDVRMYRSKIMDYLRGVEREGGKLVWDDSMEVTKTLDRLKLSLHMLRNVLHSTLPIEMYHFPDETQDEAARNELIEEYDVRLREVSRKRPDGNGISWNIKNVVFLATNFTEFIYMDSDNIPLSDPADLFDGIEYQQSGSVFWADLNKDHPDIGRICTDDHWPAEAGQLIFDKCGNNGLNLAVLHLSNHTMANPYMYGHLIAQAPKIFASAGEYQTQGGESSLNFCRHSMIQWGLTSASACNDPSYHPPPAFLQAILAKYRWNLQPDKLFSHIRRPRLDGSKEPLLVRTLYEFAGDCFAITLKGPDGMPGAENSMGDGQGVVMDDMKDLLGGGAVCEELRALSEKFVRINHND
ncbi:mannosyltransferase putative-domain-containing protein [Mycena sp. CBHHK59/15]|nr:mannosyltransferase putative-domain-containing protein [Mycena sp. CBHHK59/15]